MINVTKTFLPKLEDYTKYLEGIWERSWLTNSGPLSRELEQNLNSFLGTEHLLFCNNGTIAIQFALKALEITGEVITTPFSYVATTNSILWENCTPVFADIRADDFCIDAAKIEEKITERTQAILAVHVYGYPCDVEALEKIGKKHNLKIIYDAAHAFGVKYKNRSLLDYGDVSTCSFHATKIFHTGEGGAVICNEKELADKIRLYHMFGHRADDYFSIGINGKNSEFHAAMGLCVLPHVAQIIENRKRVFSDYNNRLDFKKISRPHSILEFEYNYAYFPVIFENEKTLLNVKSALEKESINTRRYFYPSLNTLPFLHGDACPVSESVSRRVLALPLFHDLATKDIDRICTIINRNA